MRETEKRKKQKYEKPTVTRFPLRPEEAVLGFCKTGGSSGPSGGDCQNVGFCRTPGS